LNRGAVTSGGGSRTTVNHEGEGADVGGKILVEHTSINPNKAAHIGHLRNAILGTRSCCCRRRAYGEYPELHRQHRLQVADVVVGFVHWRNTKAQIEALIADNPGSTTLLGSVRAGFAVVQKTRQTLR
jgi:hypothetical protein